MRCTLPASSFASAAWAFASSLTAISEVEHWSRILTQRNVRSEVRSPHRSFTACTHRATIPQALSPLHAGMIVSAWAGLCVAHDVGVADVAEEANKVEDLLVLQLAHVARRQRDERRRQRVLQTAHAHRETNQ